METRLWTPLFKSKSILFSNNSCIIIHRHVQIKKLLRIMDSLNVPTIVLWICFLLTSFHFSMLQWCHRMQEVTNRWWQLQEIFQVTYSKKVNRQRWFFCFPCSFFSNSSKDKVVHHIQTLLIYIWWSQRPCPT